MSTEIEFFINIAFFLIPLYLANSSAMVFGRGKRIDFGKNFIDKQPLFGKGKTWIGFFSGIAVGTIGATAAFFAFPEQALNFNSNYLLLGFLISFGALFGDLAGSFVKRRLLIQQGSPSLGLDQLDFVVGAYVFALIFYIPSTFEILFVAVFTVITHISTNYLAFKLGLKKVPW